MSQIVISAERDYSVDFVRDWKASLSDTIKNGKACVLVPKNLVEILGSLPSDWLVIELPDGESQKSGAVYLQILERLAEEPGQLIAGRRFGIVDGIINPSSRRSLTNPIRALDGRL